MLEAVKGRAQCARRERFHPLTAPARRSREELSGRRASRIVDLPPAGRTKGWIMPTFGFRDAWVAGHGDEALRQPGWMAAWDASLLEPGQHVGATCSWHLQSG